ncbi:hypothetical protein ACJMK2_004747 [Sinanodonta woodiana]|uniref:Uncharacterized protein n=1 Tax=Sinanodonta woodiana TaxID=1069815 RepID=A0ABD3VMV9_SINWO
MLLTEFKKPVKITTCKGDVRYNVGVVEHKTALTQLATVSSSESEYREIEKYITNVRPTFANKLRPKTEFLNKNGLKIHNPSMDLHSRQSDLGLPHIT